jgi:microtubule-associated protein, RP/EB family
MVFLFIPLFLFLKYSFAFFFEIATQTYEFVENYKVLQVAFKSAGIKRDIDVTSLIRAKYQDNLEFLQWIKCYYDYYVKGETGYDANAKRKELGLNVSVKCGGRGSSSSTSSTPMTTPSRTTTPRTRSTSTPQISNTTKTVPRTVTSTMPKSTVTKSSTTTSNSSKTTSTVSRSVSTKPSTSTSISSRHSVSTSMLKSKNPYEEQIKEKDSKISTLNNQIKELNQIVETLKKERDFYFNRLRTVEIYCQTKEERDDSILDIEKILYTNDENELKVEEENQFDEELDQF